MSAGLKPDKEDAMQFIVHGHHLELTESLKERCRSHIYERAEKLVDDSAARLEIVLAVDLGGQQHGKGDKICKVDLRVPGLPPIHVEELRPNMHEAIDLAADRLVEALRRAIERREDRRKQASLKELVHSMPPVAEGLEEA